METTETTANFKQHLMRRYGDRSSLVALQTGCEAFRFSDARCLYTNEPVNKVDGLALPNHLNELLRS